jgi:sulfur carrier protein
MSATIAVRVNGAEVAVPAGATVAEIVGATGIGPESRGIAVALDGEVVRRADWALTVVRDGQRIEVLTAVQGG